MGSTEKPIRITGVDPAVIKELGELVTRLAASERELQRYDLEEEELLAKHREMNAPYRQLAETRHEEVSSKIVDLFMNNVLPNAKSVKDVQTLTFQDGVLSWRKAPAKALELNPNEKVDFLKWARRAGVLRQIGKWEFTIIKNKVKELLDKHPELIRTLKGARLVRSTSLTVETALDTTTLHKVVEDVQETGQ